MQQTTFSDAADNIFISSMMSHKGLINLKAKFNSNFHIESEEGEDQESIKSSTTPDQRYYMYIGK